MKPFLAGPDPVLVLGRTRIKELAFVLVLVKRATVVELVKKEEWEEDKGREGNDGGLEGKRVIDEISMVIFMSNVVWDLLGLDLGKKMDNS